MASRASRSKSAMHRRLASASLAKSIVKPMIINGSKVDAIKDALRSSDIPVTAYNTLRDQGLVAKWKSLKH